MTIYRVSENTECGHDSWFFKNKKLAKAFFNSLEEKENFIEEEIFVNTELKNVKRSYD